MDAAAALLSPRSPHSPSFSFSPLPSPSSCPASPSSAFSFSPRPIAASPSPSRRPDLDFSSSSASSLWGSPRPFAALPLQEPPLLRRHRSPAVDVSSYATTAAEPPAANCPWAAPPLPRTHYDLLGVAPTSPPAEIRSAYRKLALHHHPDVSPLHQLDRATKFFTEINEAYTVLSDPQKKACYDLKLALESQAEATATSPISPVSQMRYEGVSSPRKYTDSSTGRVYPSINSFYREWRNTHP